MTNDLKLRIGIIGAGWIAEKAAITLNGLTPCECYAIASRSQEKADAFAAKWNIRKAYGSYAQLIADPDVDLIYVATPHSHHYDVTRDALLADKPCLVEKAFMANWKQAKAIVDLARERKVFLAEAIWTRYQPAVTIVRDLISSGRIGTPRLLTATLGYSGRIGTPRLLTATLGYSMGEKPRIMRADLCGGALLDLGIYALNFVRMFFPAAIVNIESQCVKSPTGMDLTNAISLVLCSATSSRVPPVWATISASSQVPMATSSSTTSTIPRRSLSTPTTASLSRISTCPSRSQATNMSSSPVARP